MFHIDNPATWPRTGDQLWQPWRSTIARCVSEVSPGNGDPEVLFMNGERDLLRYWEFCPKVGDRVIVSARPLDRLYSGRDYWEFSHRVVRDYFRVTKLDQRPRDEWGLVCREDYRGEFFRLSPEAGGKDLVLAAPCLAVVGLRYGQASDRVAA